MGGHEHRHPYRLEVGKHVAHLYHLERLKCGEAELA